MVCKGILRGSQERLVKEGSTIANGDMYETILVTRFTVMEQYARRVTRLTPRAPNHWNPPRNVRVELGGTWKNY